MPLLEVADVGGDGDVLEHLPPGVAEQSVRDQCAERRLAVAEIDVGPAVVVEVTEVRAHRQCHAVEPYGVRHVAERPVVVVAVQSWHLGARLQPEVHRGEIAHVGDPVAGDVQILPPVVVVVPEPGREAVRRGHDTRLARHVGELPHLPARSRLRSPSVVLEQEVVATQDGNVQVLPPVIVEVAPGDPLHVAEVGVPQLDRPVCERAVPIVVVQLARIRVSLHRLVADEQVEPAVVVVVPPRAGLRRVEAQDSRLFGDVLECPIAVVAQERVRVPSPLLHPAAPQHEDVRITVIVVVGVDDVQAARLADQARRFGAVGERPIAVVAEVPHLVAHSHGREHDVEEAVAIEVIQDGPAGVSLDGQAQPGRDVVEPLDVVFGGEDLRRDAPLRRHLVRIFPQGHVGDVHEPAGAEVVRTGFENGGELSNRGARAARHGVQAGSLDRHQARVDAVVGDTVLLLAQTHETEAEEFMRIGRGGRFDGVVRIGVQERLTDGDRLLRSAGL